jgi:hypothetical protein
VLWDLASGQPICGSPAHKQNVECVKYFKRDPTKIITAGNSNLQVGAAGTAATLAAAGTGCCDGDVALHLGGALHAGSACTTHT